MVRYVGSAKEQVLYRVDHPILYPQIISSVIQEDALILMPPFLEKNRIAIDLRLNP